jgi:hypothetical protein
VAARAIETGLCLATTRLRRIAEIAGISEELARNLLIGTDYANPQEHQRWLDATPDSEIAGYARGWAQTSLPADGDRAEQDFEDDDA